MNQPYAGANTHPKDGGRGSARADSGEYPEGETADLADSRRWSGVFGHPRLSASSAVEWIEVWGFGKEPQISQIPADSSGCSDICVHPRHLRHPRLNGLRFRIKAGTRS